MEFEVGVRIRDLGWAFGGPASGTSPGAYQVLEQIRLALTGFQLNRGCTRMKPLHERFVDRDKQGGVWVYAMRFATRSVAVEQYSEPDFHYSLLVQFRKRGVLRWSTRVRVSTHSAAQVLSSWHTGTSRTLW